MQSSQLTIGHIAQRSGLRAAAAKRTAADQVAAPVRLSVTSSIEAIENEWRQFEQRADCTPFQTFNWLATWQRCVGSPAGVTPAIVTGRRSNGELLFLLPLGIERKGFIQQLGFLGHSLCDYNAPLVAADFSDQIPPGEFAALWQATRLLLQRTEGCRHDVVMLNKMPAMIGGQANPMLSLPTMVHPSSAYITALADDWDSFYKAKRSSATRRRDRTKRKRLAEFGEVRFVSPPTPEAIRSTLATLFVQKSRAFTRMGVPDIFARPGHTDFFASVASGGLPFVHVSRFEVGDVCAAANLGLIFRGCYYHVLASYDEGPASRFGPGVAHLHDLMRYAILQGCKHFDFTIGDESYKRDWSDTMMALYDHVSGSGWVGRLAAAMTIARLAAKRRIKNSPLLWAAASRVRSMLARGK